MTMPKTQNQCRICQALLTKETWHPSKRRKQDKICKDCLSRQMKSLREEVEEWRGNGYLIVKKGSKAPQAQLDNLDVDGVSWDTGQTEEILKGIIRDTEGCRVEKILSLIGGAEDKIKRQCIEYLLKSWNELNPEQCIEVVNHANKLIFAAGVDEDVKVRVAIALKNFLNSLEGKKDTGKPQGFEHIINTGKEIEIDDEIL